MTGIGRNGAKRLPLRGSYLPGLVLMKIMTKWHAG
jgi:hypothetical protein